MPKLVWAKEGTLAIEYKGTKKEFCSTNNVEHEFWLCHDDIKQYVSDNKKKYVLDLPVLPNIWPMKIRTKRGGVGTIAEGGLSPQHMLLTIVTHRKPSVTFLCATK